MCGIAGKVSARGPVSRGLVEAMCERQVHRGPDSRGIHESDGVCLGIQRLRIIDLKTGDQPIYNEDRSVAIVLNGEIYNFRELRRELERRGHRFATGTDTEVLVHLYEDYGVDLVDHLNGMFAFAIWDERERRLMLARDRVGKKPLFYVAGDGWLSFASELHALMADEEVRADIDPSSLECYLAYGYVPAPWSIWRDVSKLPPASVLTWQDGDVEVDRYWRLRYNPKRTEPLPELEEELRCLIGAAVRRRMISDVPLGAFLSGGIDSSIVVSEMAASSSQAVKTFSIGFENERYDELPRARRVAEVFATDHHEFIVEPDAVEVLPKLVRHYGEPYADSSALPTYYLAELTRQHVTVALNGDGGDESFAGYVRHIANRLTSPVESVPRSLRARVATFAHHVPTGAKTRGLVGYANRLLRSIDREAVERYADHVSIFGLEERERLLNPDFCAEFDTTRSQRFMRSTWYTAECNSALDQLLWVDVNAYLPYDLLVKVDIATMAHSLEARSPLLDYELMEFAAALPPRAKALFAKKKRLPRRAYAGRLPRQTLNGRKRGFAVPLDDWFRGDLRQYVSDMLLGDAATRGWFADGKVERLIKEHTDHRADHSGKLWALLFLELWLREARETSAARR